MRAPSYWLTPPDKPGLLARLLSPLGLIYARTRARRLHRVTGWRAPVPVICIGKLDAGGADITPIVLAVVDHLEALGLVAVILSRGHGGALAGPVAVDPGRHGVADVSGDALLEAVFARTWIARDRVAGARALLKQAEDESRRVDCIVMDDGCSNPGLARDISIIVVDAAQGFGNGLCIPAGPLREPLSIGVKRADILLSIGQEAAQVAFDQLWSAHIDLPRMRAGLAPLETGMEWQGARVLAFAGIGLPERFFATLRALGADLAGCEALEDHKPLSRALMARLEREALRLGAQLVTTEKDAARLPAGFRSKVLTLPVRLAVTDWAPFDASLARVGLA